MRRKLIVALALVPLSAADLPAQGRGRVVSITRAWLGKRGGPYVLRQANTRYVLKTDVRTAGTAFVIDAPGVVLDLNGHKVVYGDRKPLAVRNGGFEEGSGRRVPGWDLSGAPAAELAPNTSFLFGKQVLRLKDFKTKQRLVSERIPVPSTRHTHVATITPAHGDYRTTVWLSVVDADSGRVLGKGKSANVERGFSAVAHFQPGTARAVRLEVEVTPPPGRTASLDLDEATVSASYDYGIVATNAWAGEIPGWGNLAPGVKQLARKVNNVTIRNGSVLQGAGRGYGSPPLFCNQARGLTVERVRTLTRGVDTTTLSAERATGKVVVRGCTLRHEVSNITDRGKSFAAIRLVHVNGPITVEDNELEDVPHVGILLDGASSGAPVVIRKNRIGQNVVVSNGYGIIIVASRKFEIADNRIVAKNGRGIDVDSYRKEPVEDGVIRNNYVEVRERLNREYWQRLEARALRLRNTVDRKGPHRRLRIRDNTFVAFTGPGLASKAFAVRITYQNEKGTMNDADVRLEHNTLRAIAEGRDPNLKASALVLDGLQAGVDLRIRDNTLESNDCSLTLADTEGPVAGVRLVGNTFARTKEGGARPYTAIRSGFWHHAVRDVTLVDPRLAGGAELGVEWAGTGRKEVGIARRLSVSVRRGDEAVAGAEVTVRDREGKAVFSGKTDDRGEVADVAVVTTRYRQERPDPHTGTTDERGPFRVSVTAGGKTTTRTVRLTANESLTIPLPAR